MPRSDSGDPTGSAGRLTIDLGAVAANYRSLCERLAPSGAACGAVVKADAYGLGMAEVAPPLWAEGCRQFFVAIAEEGLQLRKLLPEAEIYIFNGADSESADAIAEAALVPVLNHPGQIADWAGEAQRCGRMLPAMLHVDTGITRLGLSDADTRSVADNPAALAGIRITGVMSHLACAEDPDHGMNAKQLDAFRAALAILSPLGAPTVSFANSSGIFLGPDYHFDLARPGAALYGLTPVIAGPNPMKQVINLQGKILQTRLIDTPSAVGYGATHLAERGRRIATVGVGYADGYLRSLGGAAHAFVGRNRVPVVGRVSMDLITLDVTDVPERDTRPGTWVDLIGDAPTVDDIAREAGTIGYEILTLLGHRYARRYVGGSHP
jgi:alanine racemase